MIVTRYAPSPTGYTTSANLRTALFNCFFAKKHNGVFYCRIEDSDEKRFHPKAIEYMKDTFDWCNLNFTHSPFNPNDGVEYYQSKRDYSKYIKKLLADGNAYYAFDTAEDLEMASKNNVMYNYVNRHLFKNSLHMPKETCDKLIADGTPYVIRIKIDPNQEIVLNDLVLGRVIFNTSNIDEKVLVKSSGMGSYHLMHVCDDYEMGTTHVMRGSEWVSSYPIHHMLWHYLDLPMPEYAHLPLLLSPDGKGKVSKRSAFKNKYEIFPLECSEEVDGELKTFKGFKGLNYEPIAYLNFLALLGHHYENDCMSMQEMIDNFDIKNISVSPAIFNVEKLDFINRHHLLELPHDELWKRFPNIDKNIYSEANQVWIMELALMRAITYLDLKDTFEIFFNFDYDIVHNVKEETKQNLKDFFTTSKKALDILSTKTNKKDLRLILTNKEKGVELHNILSILDFDEVLKRVQKYI